MFEFEKLKAYSENKENHVHLTEKDMEKFSTLCEELLKKNEVVNLTAIKEPEEVEKKHFIDSLMAVDVIKTHTEKDNFSLIDIGCGAGFPGLPLKIVFPEAEFVLVDSVGKKIDFVREMIEKLELDKIVAESERVEHLARTQYRDSFDFCTARAVASIAVLLEYGLPFLKDGGRCIFYKSGNYHEELDAAKNALEILGGEVEEVKEFTLPFTTEKRSLIVIKKTGETPDKYPRKNGKPEKSPL